MNCGLNQKFPNETESVNTVFSQVTNLDLYVFDNTFDK